MDQQLQSALTDIRGSVETIVTRQKSLQTQVDAIDLKFADRFSTGIAPKSLETKLRENDHFQRLLHDRRGRAVLTLAGKDLSDFHLEQKTTITEAAQGFAATGVMPIERIPGIVPEARQVLTVRDVLSARPTTQPVVDFVRVQTAMTPASPVAEASTKPENAVVFQSLSEKVRTIATWIPATKQILDDFTELAGFLQTSLTYYVNLAEEVQLLSGDNTGENLHGLITQAQAFDTSTLSASAGWNRIDLIGRAIEQITTAKEVPPTFVILHPKDWWSIRLTKDSFGRYLLGDPQTTARANLFDLTVIPTTSMAAGAFLVGSGDATASEIRDRMELQFEVSTEHADYFVQNLVACRAEKRLALVVKRPNSYVTGTFTTSPQ